MTGGIVSGLGKGVTASSIGVLLKSCGMRVTAIKIDPYLNVDAGTMSPFEHGEVFVLDDGCEGDLDLGNYERFLDITLTRDHNLTTGKVYQQIIEKERRGDFLGKTVQVVPHITDAVQEWIERVAHLPVDKDYGEPDVCIIELGGTVGDMESMPFIEALRQLQFKVGPSNMCCVHVSLVPEVGQQCEQKTKPTQHSVSTLRSLGLIPNVLACRCARPLKLDAISKLSLFCQIPHEHILVMHDVNNIWYVPLLMEKQGLHHTLCKLLNVCIVSHPLDLTSWRDKVALHWDKLTKVVKIAVVGKYVGQTDAYLSIIKAIQHACMECCVKPQILWVEASDLERDIEEDVPHDEKYFKAWLNLQMADGIVIPGGFGSRGVEGMIEAVKYAREHRVPMLGICLGMQVTVIEYCRNVLHMVNANSQEVDALCNPVIVPMNQHTGSIAMGGSMRLGRQPVKLLTEDSHTWRLYGGVNTIDERHRHRYHVSPHIIGDLQASDLNIVGVDNDNGETVEIVELTQNKHPFYVACQYHPEFLSRPLKSSPVFRGLINAANATNAAIDKCMNA